MPVDRALGDDQLRGDLAIRLPFGDAGRDLLLSRSQRKRSVVLRPCDDGEGLAEREGDEILCVHVESRVELLTELCRSQLVLDAASTILAPVLQAGEAQEV